MNLLTTTNLLFWSKANAISQDILKYKCFKRKKKKVKQKSAKISYLNHNMTDSLTKLNIRAFHQVQYGRQQ